MKNNKKNKKGMKIFPSWLFLKQGIKSLFKYKLQLFIVFILSFMSCVLFTTGMSTDHRLTDGYNAIFKKHPKFNFEYNYSVGDSTGLQINKIAINPFLDLIPRSQSYFKSINSAPQLFLSNKYDSQASLNDLGNPTNILNFFTDNDGTVFKNNFDKMGTFNELKYDKTQTSPISLIINFNINPDGIWNNYFTQGVTNYLNSLNNDNWKLKPNNLSLIGLNFINYKKNHPLIKSSDLVSAYLKQPMIHGYLSSIFNSIIQWMNTKITNYFNNISAPIVSKLQKDSRINSSATAAKYINNGIFSDASNGNLDIVKALAVAGKGDKGEFVVAPPSKTKPKPDQTIFANLIYSYLFGNSLNKSYTDDINKLINKQYDNNTDQKPTGTAKYYSYNKYNNTTLKTLPTPLPIKPGQKTPPIFNDNVCVTNIQQLYNYGLRSMMNPLISNVVKTETQISFLNDLGSLGIESPFQTGFYLDPLTTSGQGGYENQFLVHQYLNAENSNLNIHFRNELYTYDTNNGINYRAVILYSNIPNTTKANFTDLHLYEGSLPSQGQMVISPQFARKNKWVIGSFHKVGAKFFTVSGIGTDPYSFIPSPNASDAIPNVDTSPIIYFNSSDSKSIYKQVASKEFTNVFLTNNKKGLNDNASLSLQHYYSGLMQTNNKHTGDAINYFQQTAVGKAPTYNANINNLKPNSFDSSSYRYNWTIFPKILSGFRVIIYTAASLVLFLALLACYISVSKNIKRNSAQIAILKSMGQSSTHISVSYLAYAFIVVVFAIPFGWLCGILLQWPAAEIFQNFFSLNYRMILFDWEPLLILFAILGVTIILVSLISAYRIVNKPVLYILYSRDKWHTNRMITYFKNNTFKNFSFGFKFKLSITSSSVKKIWIMSLLIAISSALITASLALPALINNISNSFYKNLNYKNKFNFYQPVYNAPLSKSTTSSWEGTDKIAERYKKDAGYELNSTTPGKSLWSGGYDNPSDFFASSRNDSVIPYFSFDTKSPTSSKNSYLKWSVNNALDGNGDLISFLSNCFNNNLYVGNGQAFSGALISGLLDIYYHSPSFLNDVDARNHVSQVSSLLDAGMPQILATVLDRKLPTGPAFNKKNWIQKIATVLSTQTPPYIQKYLQQSPSRSNQFMYGFSYTLNDYLTDSLSTSVNTIFKGGGLDLRGIQQERMPIKITNSTLKKQISNVFVKDPDTLAKLQKVLTDYATGQTPTIKKITYNNQTLFDNNTLYVPVIINKQAGATIGSLKNGILDKNIRPVINQLQYSAGNKWKPILKQFWTYDDTDFVNSDFSKKLSASAKTDFDNYTASNRERKVIDNTGKVKYYMDPYNVQNNHFTLQSMFKPDASTNQSTLQLNNYGFIDNYQKDGLIKPIARPYLEYKNLFLYLPADNLDIASYLNPDGNSSGSKYVIDPISSADVPDSVKNGVSSQKWLKIRPYVMNYDSRYDPKAATGLDNLLKKYTNWYNSALTNNKKLILNVNKVNSSPKQFTTYPGLNIKYNVVGNVDAYSLGSNSSVAWTGENLANLITGFSTAHDYSYQLQTIFKNKQPDKSSRSLIESNPQLLLDSSQYPNNKFFYNKNNAIPMWYTSKNSQSTEPFDLSTYFSGSIERKTGNYLITDSSPIYPYSTIVSNYSLYAEKQLLISRLTKIALSATLVFLFFIIICSLLLILLISNLFISQYERFMVLMKTEGYGRWKVINYTINNFTPYVAIAWAIGAFVAWFILHLAQQYIFTTIKLAIPFGITWWVFLVSFLLVAIIYLSVFWLAMRRLESNTANLLRESEGS